MFYKNLNNISKLDKLSEIIKEEVKLDFFVIESKHSLKKFEEVLVKVNILKINIYSIYLLLLLKN